MNADKWVAKHRPYNPLDGQPAACVRQQDAADVVQLDCHTLGLDEAAMLDRVNQGAPDAIFLAARLVIGDSVPRERSTGVFGFLKFFEPFVLAPDTSIQLRSRKKKSAAHGRLVYLQ